MSLALAAILLYTGSMNLVEILRKIFMRNIAAHKMAAIHRLETSLAARGDVVKAASDSPDRFEILEESLERGYREMPGFPQAILHLLSSMANIKRSLVTLAGNPPAPKTRIPSGFLEPFERVAHDLGISTLGYARLPTGYIFQHKAVAYRHAVVLTMEMDKPLIDKSPHRDTAVMVMETYDRLGKAANHLAEYLRECGFAAQAGHPLMGPVLYPPLAALANLGGRGLHGLLITPEYGPRVRLAAVFTSIENLPIPAANEYAWVMEFCLRCKFCVKKCPAGAILPRDEQLENGLYTSVDREACFPYFAANHGCSLCISKCPFNNVPYEKIKRTYHRYLAHLPPKP